MSIALMSIWTVFDHPADYPDSFVARRTEIYAGRTVATLDAVFGTSLEGVRAKLPPGLHRVVRQPGDLPSVVESWL